MLPILRRNPIVFPGTKAGYNPNHVASGPGLRYAGVAAGGNLIDIRNGSKGTIVGTITPAMTGIGPCINNITDGSYIRVPGFNDVTHTLTIGVIFMPTGVALGHDQVLFTNNGTVQNSNTCLLILNTTRQTQFVFVGGGVAANTQIVLNANEPYFVAYSAVSNQYCGSVTTDLRTGGIVATQDSGAYNFGVPTQASYLIGGNNFSNNQLNGDLAAIMYSVDPLSLGELWEWAQAPWDFWYPPVDLAYRSGPAVPSGPYEARDMILA